MAIVKVSENPHDVQLLDCAPCAVQVGCVVVAHAEKLCVCSLDAAVVCAAVVCAAVLSVALAVELSVVPLVVVGVETVVVAVVIWLK